MNAPDDAELLAEYATSRTEAAFALLVTRHIDHIYSAALRQVGNPEMAHDVVQTVFLVLERKAGHLRPGIVLGAWLQTTTRLAAREARRKEIRQLRRHEEYARMNLQDSPSKPPEIWAEIAPSLDEALSTLNTAEREVVTLHYFERRSHEEIATRWGGSEAASKKRLSRALERLRRFFARRGIAVTTVVLAGVLGDYSVQAAPAGMATAVASAAVSGSAPAGGAAELLAVLSKSATATLIKSALLGVAAVVGTITTAVAIRVATSTPGTLIALPDGSKIAVKAHYFAAGSSQYSVRTMDPIRRSLLRTVPKRFAPYIETLGGSTSYGGRDHENLTVFLGRLWSSGHPPTSPLRLVVEDDAGHTSELTEQGGHYHTTESDLAWVADAYPRRGKRLDLRILSAGADGQWVDLARMDLGYTATEEFPSWKAAPVPQTVAADGLEVRLVQFDSGNAPNRPQPKTAKPTAEDSDLPLTHLRFELSDHGSPSSDWRIVETTLTDATGNQIVAWDPMRALPGTTAVPGVAHRWIRHPLWKGEAWKIRLELARTNDANAGRNGAIRGIPIPKPTEVRGRETAVRTRGQWSQVVALPPELTELWVGGTQFQFQAIGGTEVGATAGTSMIDPWSWLQSRGQVKVVIEVANPSPNHRTHLVKITDDQGRLVPLDGYRTGPSYPLEFPVAPDATSLDFHFNVQEPRFVEFIAEPTFRADAPAPRGRPGQTPE